MSSGNEHCSDRAGRQGDAAAWVDGYLSRLAASPVRRSRGAGRAGLAELLRRHGNPQHDLHCVRIAGSKGKGSTALILDAILRRAGRDVGLFTSPHVDHWCERIRVAGRPVSPDMFAEVLANLDGDVEELRAAGDQGPDFFEVCLTAALIIFKRHAVDTVILEAGIGAATDATAVAMANLAVLTTVEAEHLDIIGPGLEDVAREKAGVIGLGAPLVTGYLPAVAWREVARQAGERGAAVHRLGHDFHIARQAVGHGADSLSYCLDYRDDEYLLSCTITTSPALYWLADNTALAIAAALRLVEAAADARVITDALADLQLPGRLELVGQRPVLIADGAHTLTSSALLASYLMVIDHAPRVLVVSFSRHHAPNALSMKLWHQVDAVVATCADRQRSRPASDICREINALDVDKVLVADAPQTALEKAGEIAGENGLVCATGSVYMAARMRAYAQNLPLRKPRCLG